MKYVLVHLALCGVCLLGGCIRIGNGMICGIDTPLAYCDKAVYEKLAHPKAYGEDWTKPNMTRASWQRDWMACGGISDGQYSHNDPSGTSDAVSSRLLEEMRQQLDSCMKAKGYTYHYTGV